MDHALSVLRNNAGILGMMALCVIAGYAVGARLHGGGMEGWGLLLFVPVVLVLVCFAAVAAHSIYILVTGRVP